MKKCICIGTLFLSACINQLRPAAITGMYTRVSMGEYSKAYDTLIIDEYDKVSGTYLVNRRTGFNRVKDGIPQPREFRGERMITLYDEATGQLTDRKSGRVFSIKDGKLLFGTAEYNKIKN